MKELLTPLCECLRAGQSVALATVLSQQGSTPRGAGSRLLAGPKGWLAGSVGGGLAEGQTVLACQTALAEGRPCVLDFNMSGALAAQSDMICGGHLRVLVEVLTPESHLPLFALAEELLCAAHDEADSPAALFVTDITEAGQPRRALYAGGQWQGPPPPPEAQGALLTSLSPAQESLLTTVAGRHYSVERCQRPWRLIIAGGGHVSRPTAQVAALAGFEVTVLDDRAEFSQGERFPWASAVRTVPEFAHCFAPTPHSPAPDARTLIVIVTRGHVHDAGVLQQALQTKASYIGMIGSTRKREQVYTALQAHGVTATELARVHCPVGLPIKAETPEEIAVSIVAQCIAHRRSV